MFHETTTRRLDHQLVYRGVVFCVFINLFQHVSMAGTNQPVDDLSPSPHLQCDTPTDSCPTWFSCSNNTCQCMSSPEHIIKCQGDRAAVLSCYCVTVVDTEEGGESDLAVGSCVFNCWRRPNRTTISSEYFVLPRNVSMVTEDTCGYFGRTGALCGQCLPNLSPKVYSFDLTCVECHHVYLKWLLFIVAAFVPLTIFYLVILVFHINIASSSIHGLVLFCQIVSSPPFARAFGNSPNHSYGTTLTKIAITLYGIWNLDFFRFFLPDICLNTSSLLSISLDYVVAVYPLILVFVTYVLISLYDRNYKAVVIVCKPFKVCFKWLRENQSSNTTIIDAFVSFFVLSFVKITSVSFDLLYPVQLYKFNSSEVSYVLFYDGTIKYFGKDHLPYAILAILFLLFFVILPVSVMLFYPYCWFQKILSCLPSRWYLMLQAFVDSAQGSFKNGTEEGSRDCRSFSGLYFLLRIATLLIFFFTLRSTFYILCGILFMLFVMTLLWLKPYKPEFTGHTNLNAGFLILASMLWFSLLGLSYAPQLKQVSLGFALVSWILPMIYATYCMLHWLFLKRGTTKKYAARILSCLHLHHHHCCCCLAQESVEESLDLTQSTSRDDCESSGFVRYETLSSTQTDQNTHTAGQNQRAMTF